MCRKKVLCTAAADYGPVNVRLLLMLLTSFVVLTVQLPRPAHAAVVRIPTGTVRMDGTSLARRN